MLLYLPTLDAMSYEGTMHLTKMLAIFTGIRQEGDALPVMASLDPGQQRYVGMKFDGDADSRAMRVGLAAIILRELATPTEAVLLADGYYRDVEQGEGGIDMAPMDDPRSTEACFVTYAKPGLTRSVALPYGFNERGRFEWREPMRGWFDASASPMPRALAVAVGDGKQAPPGMAEALASDALLQSSLGIFVAQVPT